MDEGGITRVQMTETLRLLPQDVYDRAVKNKKIVSRRRGVADRRSAVDYAYKWVGEAERKDAAGAGTLSDEQAKYRDYKQRLEEYAPGGELPALAESGQVDAQGLTDQDKLERMDRAYITETAKENAEALTKINKSLMDAALAQERSMMALRQAGRLGDVTLLRNVAGGYFRYVARGIETFPAQHVDELAVELAMPKAEVRKVLDAVVPRLLGIHKDGLGLLDGRIEEFRAEAEAEANKRMRR